MATRGSEIGLAHVDFSLKVLRFLANYRDRGIFSIPDSSYRTILAELVKSSGDRELDNGELELLYLTLGLLGEKCVGADFRELV